MKSEFIYVNGTPCISYFDWNGINLEKNKVEDFSGKIEKILNAEQVKEKMNELLSQNERPLKKIEDVRIGDFIVFRNGCGFVYSLNHNRNHKSIDVIGDDWNYLLCFYYEDANNELIAVIPSEEAAAYLAAEAGNGNNS